MGYEAEVIMSQYDPRLVFAGWCAAGLIAAVSLIFAVTYSMRSPNDEV
jgi:hypothetical protein